MNPTHERIPELVEAFHMTAEAMDDRRAWPDWIARLVVRGEYIEDWKRLQMWLVLHGTSIIPYSDEAFHRYFRPILKEKP